MITAIDFDDGHGLLLIGTESGDVRLISLLETQVVAQGSTENDLPEDLPKIRSMFGITRVSQTAVRSNLPTFYDIRKHYKIWENLPTEEFKQITRDWIGQYAVPLSFAGWSNDWTRFQRIWDWIRPFSRWGSLDVDYDFYNTSCSIARMRLQTLGDIIPVAYRTDDHSRAIFRTGERIFYCRTLDRTVDRESVMDIDYEDEDDIVLGILPLTYREFISDPLSIIPHVSDYDTQRNLTDWVPPYSHSAQSRIAGTVRTIRKYQKETSGKIPENASMESWTDEEWDENYRATNERLQDRRRNIPEFVEGPAYFVPI
ncbi:uncharacterized protein FOMMEDRAFT_142523 [Fomitiporia mediterranea MF3/22]|uniref:uncharacterized protein n=1 Tax=Fomitiporia mediterranea (strain MF3/22) TaxID=694068 RepID=UPI0004409618|nr:uncharacterized protein FOMMEDRAFT_142523 [Fomitiporia mediterranea MF3/22]EJD00064.1 hypothetical protein FOMMEDRAFT_142523 [Fomitiporia mediterranea MF3/22]